MRVRHDDPRLTPHSPRAAVIISAAQLAGTPEGLRRVLQATVGEWYSVAVHDEPVAVGLRRLPVARGPPVGQSVARTMVQEPSWRSSGRSSVART